MRRIWLAGAVAVAAAAVALAGLFFVRGIGVTALRPPSSFEDRVAGAAWRFLVPVAVRRAPNPVPASAEVLRASLRHFADHCALCHGRDGSGDTDIGRRVFPPAPDLRAAATQALTDGELFYAIEQGIPWTAMPGWSTGTDDGERQSWELVRFVRHLPALSADEMKEIERLMPRPPIDADREREIEDFLRGGPSAPTRPTSVP
jgi:mono/diheme cytochrome c family protein